MKISRKFKNKFLNKKGTIFKIKNNVYKKDKHMFYLENNSWVKITNMPLFSLDEVEIMDYYNPYIFAIFDTAKSKYIHLYTNEYIENITEEWISNYKSTIKELYSFYSDYVKEFKNNSKISKLEIHKINFITNELVERIDNTYLRKIYDIRISSKQTKIPSYIEDHYCRNADDTFYFIHISKIDSRIFNMIKNDKMFDNEKVHYNKTGCFIKSKEEPSQEELFYLKLIDSTLKFNIYKCADLKINLQS